MKTKAPIQSEMIELAMGYIIGRLWRQVEEVKKLLENPGENFTHPTMIEDACLTLWLAVQAVNRLSFCCTQAHPGATHFSIAAGNEKGRIATYIEKQLGFNPWHDKEHPTAKRWNAV